MPISWVTGSLNNKDYHIQHKGVREGSEMGGG